MYTLLDTKYKTNVLDSPSDCQIAFPHPLEHGKYRLAHASIPNTLYNVNKNNNEIIISHEVIPDKEFKNSFKLPATNFSNDFRIREVEFRNDYDVTVTASVTSTNKQPEVIMLENSEFFSSNDYNDDGEYTGDNFLTVRPSIKGDYIIFNFTETQTISGISFEGSGIQFFVLDSSGDIHYAYKGTEKKQEHIFSQEIFHVTTFSVVFTSIDPQAKFRVPPGLSISNFKIRTRNIPFLTLSTSVSYENSNPLDAFNKENKYFVSSDNYDDDGRYTGPNFKIGNGRRRNGDYLDITFENVDRISGISYEGNAINFLVIDSDNTVHYHYKDKIQKLEHSFPEMIVNKKFSIVIYGIEPGSTRLFIKNLKLGFRPNFVNLIASYTKDESDLNDIFNSKRWTSSSDFSSTGTYTGDNFKRAGTNLPGEWVEFKFNDIQTIYGLSFVSPANLFFVIDSDNSTHYKGVRKQTEYIFSEGMIVNKSFSILFNSIEAGSTELYVENLKFLIQPPPVTIYNHYSLTPGFYNVEQLISSLQELLNINVTFNDRTKRLTLQSDIAISLIPSSAFPMLGFVEEVTGTTITASRSVNLATHRSFNIVINGKTSIFHSNRQGYTFCIPITSDRYDYMYFEPNTFEQYLHLAEDKRIIDVQVKDDDGEILDLNGNDLILILEKVN